MKINDILKKIITIYPIKDFEKYPDYDWNKATEQKNYLLGLIDSPLLVEVNRFCQTVYAEKPYLLVVGSVFGIGQVSSDGKLPFPVETYYLKTGIMFGEGDYNTGKFLFDIDIEYHKNGKFIHYGDKKLKLKKFPYEILKFCEQKLKEIYEMQ